MTVIPPENRAPDHGFFNALLRIDVSTGEHSTFEFPKNEIAEEHLYVPSGSHESQGWIVGTTVDWADDKSHLYVFHPENISDGPIAKATIDRLMPLGLHGTFAPRL